MGSVSYHKGSGLYQGTVSLGTDANGKRLRRVVYGRTQADVVEKMKGVMAEAEAGVVKTASESTHVFLRRWLKHVEQNNELRASTIQSYTYIIEQYVIGRLPDVALGRVTPLTVQGLLDALRNEGKSGRVRFHVHTYLGRAFKQAVMWNLIARNPVDGVERPVWRPKRFETWTPEQAGRFLAAAEGHRMYPLFALALATGMREGELIGLRRRNLDLQEGAVDVVEQMVELEGKHVGHAPVKTDSGNRTNRLPPAVVAILRKHLADMMAEGLAGCELVFPTREGTPYLKTNVLRTMKRVAKAAGVPTIRMHDTRHTVATHLIGAGVPAEEVKQQLGHSQLSITVDTYVKPTKKVADRVGAAIGDLFFSAK